MAKEKNEKIMEILLQDDRLIKEAFTGIYFEVKNKKLQTSFEIHTRAGGDPETFRSWEKFQEEGGYSDE